MSEVGRYYEVAVIEHDPRHGPRTVRRVAVIGCDEVLTLGWLGAGYTDVVRREVAAAEVGRIVKREVTCG